MNRFQGSLALLLASSMLYGCSSSTADSTTDMEETTTEETTAEETTTTDDGKDVKIGIIQLAEHPALDEAREGFEDYLKENGFADATFDYRNAQGDQSNCSTIAQTFVNDKEDLIYAIATPAAQAVANETDTIPIVVCAVTDLVSAGLIESNEAPGTNVTGASDLNPVDAQISLLKKLLPNASTVGIMYNNAEENSRFQADLAKTAIEENGMQAVEATVTDSNQIQQVTESLIGKVDAIYIPTDNMLAEGMATVAQVANENGLPTIVGESNMVENGGLATYGLDYYELGKLAGEQAVAILEGKSEPKDMAVVYLPEEGCELCINTATAEKLGIEIPEDVLKDAVVIGED